MMPGTRTGPSRAMAFHALGPGEDRREEPALSEVERARNDMSGKRVPKRDQSRLGSHAPGAGDGVPRRVGAVVGSQLSVTILCPAGQLVVSLLIRVDPKSYQVRFRPFRRREG